MIITMNDGSKISEEISVADAHPAGKRPFQREQYINKFRTLTNGLISKSESNRFLTAVQNLKKLPRNQLNRLNIEVIPSLRRKRASKNSIF